MRNASFLVLVLALVGCGHTVVSTQGSGSGGSGTTTGSNGSTVTVGTNQGPAGTGASTGTGPDPTDPMLCAKFCAASGTCYANCMEVCDAYQAPPCQKVGAEFVACLTGNFNPKTCQVGEVCNPGALSLCRSMNPQNCGMSNGSMDGTSCTETAQCAGGEERVICNIMGTVAACTCYLNAMPIYECNDTSMGGPPANACSLSQGCCGKSFGT